MQQSSRISPSFLVIVLLSAMTWPMLILYAVGSLAPWLTLSWNLPLSQLGIFSLLSFGIAAFLSLFSGGWVAEKGIVFSLKSIFCLVFFAYGLLAFAHSFYVALIAAFLCGIAQALANPVTNLLIVQSVEPQKRARMVGVKQAGVQLAALIAGFILPAIATGFSWQIAIVCVLPFIAFSFYCSHRVTSHSQKVQKKPPFSAPNMLLWHLMIIQWLAGMSLSAFVTFLPSFAISKGLSLPLAGTLLAYFGGAGMLSRIFLTGLADKATDESLVLSILFVMAAFAVVSIGWAGSHYVFWILIAILMGASAVATNAIAMSMLIKDNSFGHLASASGLLSAAFFAGLALGPALFGCFFELTQHYEIAWAFVVLLLITSAILSVFLWRVRAAKRILNQVKEISA